MSESLLLEFESSNTTSPLELSTFLQLFVSVYRALGCLEASMMPQGRPFELPVGGLLSKLSKADRATVFCDSRLDTDPEIVEINQHSPISIMLTGGIGLLFVAAVLSGGEQSIELGPLKLKFNLTSLGESIQKLRNAFSKNSALQTGYGFRGASIRLNQEEYNALMKPVNLNGGFQRFLYELQIRIRPGSKILHLSNRDIEQILRHKNNPARGGFQFRFDKIFKRHFP